MTHRWEVVARAAELAERGRLRPRDRRLATGPLFGAARLACSRHRRWADLRVDRRCVRGADRDPRGAACDRRRRARLLLLGDPRCSDTCPRAWPSSLSRARATVHSRSTSSLSSRRPTSWSSVARRCRTRCATRPGPRVEAELADGPEFSATEVDARAVVVIATQGHGDEGAVEHAVNGSPAYVGLVASRKRRRGARSPRRKGVPQHCSIEYGCRSASISGTPRTARSRCRSWPSSCSCGHQGRWPPITSTLLGRCPRPVDPVCGMTVTISPDALSLEREGVTYYFCSEGCRTSFAKEARC